MNAASILLSKCRKQLHPQLEFGKRAITIYNFVRHEVLTPVLMNMPAMRTDICIPSQEPASSIFRAVQQKHNPWTTMKLMLQAPPKQSHLHTKLHCNVSQKTEIVNLCHGTRILGSIRRMLGFMLEDLTFSCQFLHKERKAQIKTLTGSYKKDQNWCTHMLHHSILHPAK
jgi:hypothetical protein